VTEKRRIGTPFHIFVKHRLQEKPILPCNTADNFRLRRLPFRFYIAVILVTSLFSRSIQNYLVNASWQDEKSKYKGNYAMLGGYQQAWEREYEQHLWELDSHTNQLPATKRQLFSDSSFIPCHGLSSLRRLRRTVVVLQLTLLLPSP
jgi:hypothetical protein